MYIHEVFVCIYLVFYMYPHTDMNYIGMNLIGMNNKSIHFYKTYELKMIQK